jgi:hypothetical protein
MENEDQEGENGEKSAQKLLDNLELDMDGK